MSASFWSKTRASAVASVPPSLMTLARARKGPGNAACDSRSGDRPSARRGRAGPRWHSRRRDRSKQRECRRGCSGRRIGDELLAPGQRQLDSIRLRRSVRRRASGGTARNGPARRDWRSRFSGPQPPTTDAAAADALMVVSFPVTAVAAAARRRSSSAPEIKRSDERIVDQACPAPRAHCGRDRARNRDGTARARAGHSARPSGW